MGQFHPWRAGWDDLALHTSGATVLKPLMALVLGIKMKTSAGKRDITAVLPHKSPVVLMCGGIY